MAAVSHQSIVVSLWHQARANGTAAAIVGERETVSFAELWQRIQRVAGYLHGNGINRGDRVAILSENNPDYVAVFYGAMLAGAAVVPLNTGAKSRDFCNWIEHCGAAFTFIDFSIRETQRLAQEQLQSRICSIGETAPQPAIIETTDWASVLSSPKPDTEYASPSLQDLACILYTSGTTGHPKGVMISHGNLAANVAAILDIIPIQAGDRFLNVLPFYYSYGNSILHTHLVKGATLYLQNSMMYPAVVVERMEREAITGFAGVPSTYSLLLGRGMADSRDLAALRYVLQAGAAMPVSLTKDVREHFCQQLYVMYGQTEATARIACLPPEQLLQKVGSVGLPVPGVEVELRGPEGNVCCAGETGEVFVRGNNVAQGYWHNANATAATFIDGWLKTGDLGYRDSDGYLFLTGRRSDIIKSGANRISPTEIEDVIIAHPDVEEVAVVGVEDDLLGQVIAAAVVIVPGRSLDVRQLKKHCLDNLASYKVPRHIRAFDALPKTASGKIQRHTLTQQFGKQHGH